MEADNTEETDLKQLYITEMLVPSGMKPMTEEEWATSHGVSARQIRRWKNDPKFQERANAHFAKLNLGPERVQEVMENMWRIASTETGATAVSAAQLYMRLVDELRPRKRAEAEEPVGFEAMTEAQLVAAAREMSDPNGAD